MVTVEPGTDRQARIFPFERATRAILFVDVVESVRLIEKSEDEMVSRWLGLIQHVREQLLPELSGRLVKILGDGMLLDFTQARSAVAAAFAIRRIVHRDNAAYPPDRHMLLRMGIEASEVIVEQNDLFGRGVSLASRLTSLAGPNEIVVSAHVLDELTPELDADVEDLGSCFLRHMSEPVRAYRVGPPGERPALHLAVPLGSLAPTIAVVPFAARNVADDFEMVGDVLAEELIRELSHMPELSVISRLSTTAFRGRDATFEKICAHLHADYVLSGKYGCNDQEVVVDAELAEAKSGRIVWTDQLKVRLAGLLSEEQELVNRLIAAVSMAVMSRELDRAKLQPLATLKSYTLLLGGIAAMHRLSLRDFEEARHLLQTLVDRGTRQAIPQAWLGYWHVLRVQQGWSVDQVQDGFLALECTKRALDADPDCSLALAVDGFVHTNLLKKLDIAQQRYDRAIEVNPNDALAWLLRGTLCAFRGEGGPAVRDALHALRLTPLHPHRYFYESLAATACLAAEQYDLALDLARRSRRANRTHTSTLRAMAIAQWQLGQYEGARETLQELLRLEPNLTVRRWLARSPSALFSTGQQWAQVLRQVGVPY